jgi:hypothetical protein
LRSSNAISSPPFVSPAPVPHAPRGCNNHARDVARRGREFFAAVCEQDLEGIVAKWKGAPYNLAALPLSWLKVKNPDYSQGHDRHKLFERVSTGSDSTMIG